MSPPLIELLYEALNTPLGLIVRSADAQLLRNKLYPLRKSDPDLACLSFVVSPTQPETDLWIVRKPEKTVAES